VEIEIFKPIFYSLGNFIFQNETVTKLPYDFYESYDLKHTDTVADAFDARQKESDSANTNSFGESLVPY
jgi:poly-gamma-glutamate synthesis protein (capsule biosynthesis protein)